MRRDFVGSIGIDIIITTTTTVRGAGSAAQGIRTRTRIRTLTVTVIVMRIMTATGTAIAIVIVIIQDIVTGLTNNAMVRRQGAELVSAPRRRYDIQFTMLEDRFLLFWQCLVCMRRYPNSGQINVFYCSMSQCVRNPPVHLDMKYQRKPHSSVPSYLLIVATIPGLPSQCPPHPTGSRYRVTATSLLSCGTRPDP